MIENRSSEEKYSLINDVIKSLNHLTIQTRSIKRIFLRSKQKCLTKPAFDSGKQKEAEIYKINKLLGRNLDSKEVYEKDFSADILSSSHQNWKRCSATQIHLLKNGQYDEMNKAMIDANSRELIPDLMVQGMLMRMRE